MELKKILPIGFAAILLGLLSVSAVMVNENLSSFLIKAADLKYYSIPTGTDTDSSNLSPISSPTSTSTSSGGETESTTYTTDDSSATSPDSTYTNTDSATAPSTSSSDTIEAENISIGETSTSPNDSSLNTTTTSSSSAGTSASSPTTSAETTDSVSQTDTTIATTETVQSTAPSQETTTEKTAIAVTTPTTITANPTLTRLASSTGTASTAGSVETSFSASDILVPKILIGEISPIMTTDQKITVLLNMPPDDVIFRITGPQNKTFPATQSAPLVYFFRMPAGSLPDGTYRLIVTMEKNNQRVSDSRSFEVRKNSPEECRVESWQSLLECRDYLLQTYQSKIGCGDLAESECRAMIQDRYMDAMSYAEKQYDILSQKMDHLAERNETVANLEKILNEDLEKQDIVLSIRNKEKRVKILNALQGFVLDKEDGLKKGAPLALAIDTDGDGILDDIERRIGTDRTKADTDGDGYGDLEEIMAGYNPIGEGKAEIFLYSIEQALLKGKPLEHPIARGIEKENFLIGKLENSSDNRGGYVFYGQADPDSVVTLYIYSDIPIVTTVSTDKYGNWEYHFEEQLEDGKHEVYVVLNDDTGKVLSKSKPFDLLIREAKAVSPEDLASLNEGSGTASKNMISYYIAAAVLIIFLAILAFIFTLLKQKNKLQQ